VGDAPVDNIGHIGVGVATQDAARGRVVVFEVYRRTVRCVRNSRWTRSGLDMNVRSLEIVRRLQAVTDALALGFSIWAKTDFNHGSLSFTGLLGTTWIRCGPSGLGSGVGDAYCFTD
jgi:hypothetical protein